MTETIMSDYPNTNDPIHAIADLPEEIRDSATKLVGEFISSLGEDGSAVLAQRTSSLVRLVWTKGVPGWLGRPGGGLDHDLAGRATRGTVMTNQPRCMFAVRYPAGDGKWRYQKIQVACPGHGAVEWPQVPDVGDLVFLWDDDKTRPQPEGGPTFRVLERYWAYPSWGSVTWPYGKDEPSEGPMVDVIVEPADGPYRDETPICAESTCEAVRVNGEWWMPPGADEPDPHEHRPYEATPAPVAQSSQSRR